MTRARGLEIFKVIILSNKQRKMIENYIYDLSVGKFRAMSPSLRQLRFRNKKLNFAQLTQNLITLQGIEELKTLEMFKSWDYEEMISDLNLLKALVDLKVPKGRIVKNLKGVFTVRQTATKNQAEMLAKFVVRHPPYMEYFEAGFLKMTPEEAASNALPIDWLQKGAPQTEPSESTSPKSSSDLSSSEDARSDGPARGSAHAVPES